MGASLTSKPGPTNSEFKGRVPEVPIVGLGFSRGGKLKTWAPTLTGPLWANHFELSTSVLQNRDNNKTYISGVCNEDQVNGYKELNTVLGTY